MIQVVKHGWFLPDDVGFWDAFEQLVSEMDLGQVAKELILVEELGAGVTQETALNKILHIFLIHFQACLRA